MSSDRKPTEELIELVAKISESCDRILERSEDNRSDVGDILCNVTRLYNNYAYRHAKILDEILRIRHKQLGVKNETTEEIK